MAAMVSGLMRGTSPERTKRFWGRFSGTSAADRAKKALTICNATEFTDEASAEQDRGGNGLCARTLFCYKPASEPLRNREDAHG